LPWRSQIEQLEAETQERDGESSLRTASHILASASKYSFKLALVASGKAEKSSTAAKTPRVLTLGRAGWYNRTVGP